MKKTINDFSILIVEDEPAILDLLEDYLKKEGESVDGALRGEIALSKHQETPYDLLIVDINLPDISGIDLMKRIRTFDSVVEFIIITGYASLESAIEALRLGAFDYIIKPFRIEELKNTVKNVKEKVILKHLNGYLFKSIENLYNEIQRYSMGNQTETFEKGIQHIHTQKIMDIIRTLEDYRKGRFLID